MAKKKNTPKPTPAKTNKKKRPPKQKSRKSTPTNTSFLKDKKVWLPILGILALTFALFSTSLQNEFTNWDDPTYIMENPYITSLSFDNIKTMFTEPIAYNYHPLTILSLAFNYSFSGLNPTSYFVVNILLHLLNTFLVFWFVYLLSNPTGKTKHMAVAVITALFFGIHPMHVESVSWMAERKDVLYTCFYIGAFIAYIKNITTKQSKYYIATILLFILSGLAKPAAIVFPIVLLVIDFWYDRISLKNINMPVLVKKIPFFVLAVIFGLLTLNAQSQDLAVMGDFEKFNFFQRILLACYGLMMYIVKFFVPIQLSAFYPYPDAEKALPIAYYLAPFFVLGLSGVAIWSLKKTKVIAVGLLFYAINLVLVLQLVSIGNAIIADRYTYVPYLGLLFILGMGYVHYTKTKPSLKPALLGLVVVYGLACSYLTFERTKIWTNSENLWTSVIAVFPKESLAFNSRGNAFYDKNDKNKAFDDYSKAVALDPDNHRALTNRGSIQHDRKKYQEALKDFTTALKGKPKHYEGYIARAKTYEALGKKQEALADYNASIAAKPSYNAYYGRALFYKQNGDLNKALVDYTKAIEMNPAYHIGYTNRGNVYFSMEKYDLAIKDYNKVLRLKSDESLAYGNRGTAYYKLGKHEQAIKDLTQCVKLNPKGAGSYYLNRSFVYRDMGDKANALKDAQKAQSLGTPVDDNYLNSVR